MSNDSSNKGLSDFLKRISGLVTAVIAFVTTLVGFIKLLQGNTGPVAVILLILGTGVLWLTSLHIYFKKKVETGRILGRPQKNIKRPTYSKSSRRIALMGIFAVPIIMVVGFVGWRYYQNLPSDDIIILVADFDGPDPQKYRVTEIIVEQLREATKEYEEVQIQPLNKAITAQEGSDFARAKGKEHKANTVLWGWYGKTEEKVFITVHFELLQKPSYLKLKQEKQTLKLPVAQLNSFEIQTRLSGEMSYLTLLTIGLARYEAEDYDGAIIRFTKALTQKAMPDQMISPGFIYFNRGRAYTLKREFDRAIADYDQTIKLKPDLAVAYTIRGNVYYFKGEYDRAIADYNQTIKLKPDDADVYQLRGFTYFVKGEYDRAIADYDQIVKLKPEDADAYSFRGWNYYLKGEYDRAIADYDEAFKLKPNDADTYYNRAITYADKGEFGRAIADYDQLIKLKSEDAGAYYGRGDAYAMKGDLDNALTDFDQAIKLKPDGAEAYRNRGVVHTDKGNYDRAIADLDQAIKLKPDFALAFYNRGKAYAEKGDLELAIADYSKAIELKPDFADAYFLSGAAYRSLGKCKLAIEYHEKSLAQKLKIYGNLDHPSNAAIYFNLSLCQRQILDHAGAVASLKQATKIGMGENQPFAALLLADSLRVLGRSREAEKPLQETLATVEGGAWPSDLLKLYLRKVNPEEVVETAIKAKEKGDLGPSCEVGFYVGLWYLRRGEREKAKALFKRSIDDKVYGYIEPPMAEEMLKQMEKEKSQHRCGCKNVSAQIIVIAIKNRMDGIGGPWMDLGVNS